MTHAGPRSVCVLANWLLNTWQVRSLEKLLESTDAEISLVLVDETTIPEAGSQRTISKEIRNSGSSAVNLARRIAIHRPWSLVVAERKLAALLGDDHPLRVYRTVAELDCFDGVEMRTVRPISDGAWNELPTPAVEAVASRSDVVVRYGFGLIRGEILDATEYGVLSFHPGDIRRYRGIGTPTAFLDDAPSAGTTLQRLNEDVDAGEIVAEGRVDTAECATLWDVQDRQQRLQIELLAEGVRNLRDPTFEPTVPESLGTYRSPTQKKNVDFALRILSKNISGRLSKRRRDSTADLETEAGAGSSQ